jgi:hypothetical protein
MTQPLVAMIALDAPALPPVADLTAFHDGTWKDAPPLGDVARADDMLTVAPGGARAVIAVAAHPIPWEELEGPCQAAWWWPEAEQKLRKHKAHLLITLTGDEDLVTRTMRLTRLVAAVAASSRGAIGVYWGAGTLVHSPEAFIEDAAQMTREELPLNLWVDFRPQRNGDGTLGIFTTGMTALGQMELEVAASRGDPERVMARVVELAYQLVDQGVHPADGERVGEVAVRHRASLFARDEKVLQIEI